MTQAYTPAALVLAAQSAESKFTLNRVKGAVAMLPDIHPDLDGRHLLFYANDERYARASVDTCDCLQFRSRREVVCPHRLAVMLHFKAVKIEREMKTVYPKVIEQMLGLMSDPFAIEHFVRVSLKVTPSGFYLGFDSDSSNRTIVHQLDSCYLYGYDLADMCREVFGNYQSIKERYRPRQATHMGMVVDPAENSRGYSKLHNLGEIPGEPTETLLELDPAISAKARQELLLALRTGQATKDEDEASPDPTCPYCHGTGVVNDLVDYGSTQVSMPSACECTSDDDWDSLTHSEKMLEWQRFLNTLPRDNEQYGTNPLGMAYGVFYGVRCKNCLEVFGAHHVYKCPVEGGGDFKIDRIPAFDKEDLTEID